jgi:hypothetical protein
MDYAKSNAIAAPSAAWGQCCREVAVRAMPAIRNRGGGKSADQASMTIVSPESTDVLLAAPQATLVTALKMHGIRTVKCQSRHLQADEAGTL